MKVFYVCYESVFGNGIVVNMAVEPALTISQRSRYKYHFFSFSSSHERKNLNYRENKENYSKVMDHYNISHTELPRGSKWHILSKFFDILVMLSGVLIISFQIFRNKLYRRNSILHGRGYGGTLICFMCSILTRTPFVFDPRGLFIEEAVLDGKIKSMGLVYYALKKLELLFLVKSKRVICVSDKMKDYFLNNYKRVSSEKFVVVPNGSRDYEVKRDKAEKRSNRSWVYLGSVKPWHMLSEAITFLNTLSEISPVCNELTILSANAEGVREEIKKLNKNVKVEIRSVPAFEVLMDLEKYDYGFCLRISDLVSTVSSPVKFFEYVTAGVKVVYSKDCGDLDDLNRRYNWGWAYDNALSVQKNARKFLNFEKEMSVSCHTNSNFARMSNYINELESCYAE